MWTGGRGLSKSGAYISLSGLHQTLRKLVPIRYVHSSNRDFCYEFIRNFWLVVRGLWPTEFGDHASYKLQTVPGQGGLAGFGQQIFRAALPAEHISQDYIREAFKGGAAKLDWDSKDGPLRLATGKGGKKHSREIGRSVWKTLCSIARRLEDGAHSRLQHHV